MDAEKKTREYLVYKLTQMADAGPLRFDAETIREAARALESAGQGEVIAADSVDGELSVEQAINDLCEMHPGADRLAMKLLAALFTHKTVVRYRATPTPQQPEARVGGADFRDILYGAKVKLWLNPEDDESSVPLVVDATSGPTDNLEIMLHAEQDGEVVKLYTAPPAKVPEGMETLRHIAAIAHDGFLGGLTVEQAMVCIRQLSLAAWDRSGSTKQRTARVTAAMLAAAPEPREG